jgi:restriction system protein
MLRGLEARVSPVAVPDFQTLMRPLLELLDDGRDHHVKAIRADLARRFSLGQADIEELIPSGRVTTFQNRVGWATTYLYRTALIERPTRATYRINHRGRQVLAQNQDRVDLKVLSQFVEFKEFRQLRTTDADSVGPLETTSGAELTPEERIDSADRELRAALAADLLDQIFDRTPSFFEQIVLDLLQAMGYGGDDVAERLGRSGDEGIDGIIREDRLGLNLIYLQAKRWKKVVGRPEIHRFFGALHGQGAAKGVYITTSGFSREAVKYAAGTTPRIVLMDGQELTQLMIEHNVGVTVSREYKIKRLDLDYFATDEDDNNNPPPPDLNL